MKPLLFVAGHVPAYRTGALAALHEREGIEVALFGGRSLHGGPAPAGPLPFPSRRASPGQLARLAARGPYRGVICPTAGRLAPLATWAGARAGRRPLILWASLWAHPLTPAHALSYLPLRRLYASADAVVTYGPHVSAYVCARGARNVHVAPQSVDNDFWGAPLAAPPAIPGWPAAAGTRCLFVGRPVTEKGLDVLLAAWARVRASSADPRDALILVGAGPDPAGPAGRESEQAPAPPMRLGTLDAQELRAVYGACEVLVVPSLATRRFREPWGLVVNEAMNRGLAVIASDAVGAAAGGLVRDGETGLVVPEGDVEALAEAIGRVSRDAELRGRLGSAGASEVRSYSHAAWAEGFSGALATVGLSRERW